MRWKTAGLCVLALVGSLGCPHSFGRGGTLDKAVRKDVKEGLDTQKCTQEELELYCDEDPDGAECLRECG
jgi:hypothetical protein